MNKIVTRENKSFTVNKNVIIRKKSILENDIEINKIRAVNSCENQLRDFLNVLKSVNLLELTLGTILWHILFTTELFLKLFLLKYSYLDIKNIDEKGHKISLLIKVCIDSHEKNIEKQNNFYGKIDFNKLENLVTQFKNKNMNNLNLNEYSNFKYNRKEDFIYFNDKLTDEQKKLAEEVIEWLNSNILILLKH